MKSISARQTPPSHSIDVRRIAVGLLLVVACWFASCSSSFAATCILSSPTLTFGSINPQSTATIYTSGTANISCTGLPQNTTISVCLSIANGDAIGSTNAERTISRGGRDNQIPIIIKSSPSSPVEIGTGNPYPKAGPIYFLTNASGSGSTNFPISVSLSGPISVAAGAYSNKFGKNDFGATYKSGVETDCNPVKSNAEDAQLLIQATVVAGCSVTATAMDFGTISVLSSSRSATSTVTLSCTQGVTATIALDNGQTGTGPVTRQLRLGTSAINYGIYRNSSYTLPWGQTAGSNTVSLPMGLSTFASVTAYGLVPSQGTPVPGRYTDVVNVIISY